MSRSRKRTPVCGMTTAHSEKEDKRRANRKLRRRVARAPGKRTRAPRGLKRLDNGQRRQTTLRPQYSAVTETTAEIRRIMKPHQLAASTEIVGLRTRPLVPWLVTYRDFHRYLYRALNACKHGRVVFFYHRQESRKQKMLIALTPYPDWERTLARARESFAEGRVKKVRLEDQPAIRQAVRKRTISPEYMRMMAQTPGNDIQAALDEDRGTR